MPTATKTTYWFTLTLSGVSVITVEMADALFAAGCDDCTPGSSGGIVTIAFHRESESLGDAVGSAIRDVERAGFHIARVEIESAGESA